MKIAYFDCFSGVSGDMCLGALVSAGVDFDRLKAELAKMPVTGYDLRCEKGKKNSISCVNIFVDLLEEEQPARGLADILQIIEGSDLPGQVKDKSKEVFMRLAAAEAAIHDTTPERIHFHEVGAVDAIVDVVGTVWGLHQLEVDQIYASPLPVGRGFIKCMHGIIPTPAPATLQILHNVPIYGTGVQNELVTPTGAALLAVLAQDFINLPPMIVGNVGYGAGKNVMEHPNLLRLIVGESYAAKIRGHHHICPHGHKRVHTHTDHTHTHEPGPGHDHCWRHKGGHSHDGREHDHHHDQNHCHDHALDHCHCHDHDHDHKSDK
ncbi:MAG: DUF111 family protein [Peptococcaceae bacterium]|nr:DUF111 family protein [Candidatus Syntrophopropionicum ammoniitolerans]